MLIISGNCVPNQNLPRTSIAVPQVKARSQTALIKIHELEKIVENWDSKDLGQCCNEFVRGKILLYAYSASLFVISNIWRARETLL